MRKLTGLVERVVEAPQDCLIQAQEGGRWEKGQAASGVVAGGAVRPGLKVSLGDVGPCKMVKRKQRSMERGSRREMKDKPSSL